MNKDSNYESKKVVRKTFFNIGFQIVPIAAALLLTPYLIMTMGKDAWAKYATGISLIFLSNYFSFGIGPTLNRRVSEIIGRKQPAAIHQEMAEGISFSYLLGGVFFIVLQIALYIVFLSGSFSIVQSLSDYYFYSTVLFVFLLAFLIIPYRSLLESFSDFYFLAIIRAITAAVLFVVPAAILFFGQSDLMTIAMALLLFYIVLYVVYVLRAKAFEGRRSFELPTPLGKPVIKRTFTFEMGFLKETAWFSLFFLCTAIVLFFDRFYYPIFFDTQVIADQVTLLDLFNRVAIVTGTISLVYFSAISVWFQEGDLFLIKKNLKRQLIGVGMLFLGILLVAGYLLDPLLQWWLKESYAPFMEVNGFALLCGALLINFTILLIRPLQAIGQTKAVSLWLTLSTMVYVVIVVFLGIYRAIDDHYLAFIVKAGLDLGYLLVLLRRNKVL